MVMKTPAQNILRWEESGNPREWVLQRNGQWTHSDWEVLLSTLKHSEFWPMEPEGIGILLEKLRTTLPGTDSSCPECGDPNSGDMANRGVEVTLFRVFATLPCLKCNATLKVELRSVDKAEGVDVRCSCGGIAHIPPSVWCRTCGKGLSTAWQSKVTSKR